MEIYNNKGQSLFEVVVAIALISIVMITLVSLASLSIRASVLSRNQTEAGSFTQQASEWLRSEKDADWTTFNNHAKTTNWCLDSLYWSNSGTCSSTEIISGTIFKRSLKFTRSVVGSNITITADISTSWKDSQGTHSVITSDIFTNWQ